MTKSKQTTVGAPTSANTEMEYTYNLSGALIRTRYPSGREVENEIDSTGRLSLVRSKKTQNHGMWNYANSFSYSAAGAVSDMQLGNGKWESTAFNSRLQPTQIALGTTPGAANLLDLEYEYDTGTNNNNGNVLKQTINVPVIGTNPTFEAIQTYTYDELNRLKTATENIDANPTASWVQTFLYDRYGNKNFDEANTTTLTKNCGGGSAMCATDREVENPEIDPTNNRIKELQPDGDSNKDYEFDAAGNTINDPEGREFFYDGENKQVKVEDSADNTIGEYFYDGDGKRIKKVIPSTGETTFFQYDAGGKLISEYSTVIEPASTAKVSYLTNDHLGSPRITSDKDGNAISRRDFLPFGEELTALITSQRGGYGGDSVRQKFTGYERDDEIGLDFAQARFSAFVLGRFTSTDPSQKSVIKIDPQSWNRYLYCYNRPLILKDDNGKWPTKTHNKLIRRAFKGLTSEQITNIQLGSKKTDWSSEGKPISTAWPSEAHKHAMRMKDLDPDKAWGKAVGWLQKKMEEVVRIQEEHVAAGGEGISNRALYVLGEATHTYEDASSPAHGFDKEYSIPTKVKTINMPGGTVAVVTVYDAEAYWREKKAHDELESGEPTEEQYQTTMVRSRAFFLIAFGEEEFAKLEMSDEERQAARGMAAATIADVE